MRISAGKTRAALPMDFISERKNTGQSRGPHATSSHDSTFTFNTSAELNPMSSAGASSYDLDVATLTDDEVRERFKSVMVRRPLSFVHHVYD